jgi:hypothetical protein
VEETFPALRFDNLADYPQFDFYLKYARGPGSPYASPHLVPVQSGEAVRVTEGSGRTTQFFLLAVPHGEKPPAPRAGPDWLREVPAGCLQSGPLQGIGLGAGYLVPYRVSIADGALDAVMQPAEWLAGEWSLWWLKRLPCVLVPLAFCAALAWLGVRVAVRLLAPRPARPA